MKREIPNLQPLFEYSADLMCVGGLDGYFQVVNPAFCKALGYTEAESTSIPFLDLLHPADRGGSIAELERLRSGEDVLRFKNRFRCRNGSYKWLSWTAAAAPEEGLFYAVGRDITDSQQSLDDLLGGLPGMVYRCLIEARWTMSFVSRGCQELTGYPAEAFTDDGPMSYHGIVHSDDRAALLEEMQAAIAEKREFQMEYRIATVDGTEKLVWEKGRAFYDGQGRQTTLQGYVVDITDQRKLRNELTQLQRMESLGQLTGGVAHDFNNLLTIMIGNLELLQVRISADPQVSELIGDALSSAWRGAELCQRLLAFGRRQMLTPELTDINELLMRMDGLIRRSINGRIEIRISLSDARPRVFVDAGQLENAILNLAINARDAMPDGGWLHIHASHFSASDQYAAIHPDVQAGEYVVIEVSDSGTGMPPSVRDRAFEPFFTTKEQGKGTGLGLSMVYGLLKQSGGHARIYSEPGHGTSVKLFIPVPGTTDGRLDETTRLVESDLVPGGTESILVVEDDPGVRAMVVTVLTECGYNIVESDSGAAALDILGTNTTVELLFTDVIMPGGVDGVSLAAQAVDRNPALKVLLTSGFSQQHVASRGGFALLSKPYSKRQLAAAVRQALDS